MRENLSSSTINSSIQIYSGTICPAFQYWISYCYRFFSMVNILLCYLHSFVCCESLMKRLFIWFNCFALLFLWPWPALLVYLLIPAKCTSLYSPHEAPLVEEVLHYHLVHSSKPTSPTLHEYWLICVYLRLQHVWSESEDCLPFLQLAQDYISSCGKKTLLEVLEKVFTSFRPVRKKQMSVSQISFERASSTTALWPLLAVSVTNPIHSVPSGADKTCWTPPQNPDILRLLLSIWRDFEVLISSAWFSLPQALFGK